MKKNILLTITLIGFSVSIGMKASDNGKPHDEDASFKKHFGISDEENCYQRFLSAFEYTSENYYYNNKKYQIKAAHGLKAVELAPIECYWFLT